MSPAGSRSQDRENAAQFPAIFDHATIIASAPLILFATDRHGRFTLMEGQATEAAGIRPADLIGQDALAVHGLMEVRERSGRVTGSREVLERVMRGETVNGLTEMNGRHFENTFIPIRTPSGEIDGLMGVSFDVTDLQRSTVALGSNEEQMRMVLENISDVITVLGADATILYESRSVKGMLGFEPEELVGHSAFEFIHPDDAQAVVRAVDRSRHDVAMEQFRFRHKNGEWRRLEGIGRVHTGEDGSHTAVVVSRDVTDRERATAESRLLQYVTLHMAEAKDRNTALEAVMRLVCESMGWAYAEVWLPSADGRCLEPSRMWYAGGAGCGGVQAQRGGSAIRARRRPSRPRLDRAPGGVDRRCRRRSGVQPSRGSAARRLANRHRTAGRRRRRVGRGNRRARVLHH